MQPVLRIALNSRAAQRVRNGYPWVFRSDAMTNPGFTDVSVAQFTDTGGRVLATGYVHPKNQLMGRVLALGERDIDHALFVEKFTAALAWREQCFDKPYYRLVHAESDGLPGLVVDRFGDTLVVQANSAGMDMLKKVWLPALHEVVKAHDIVLKNDGNTRTLEGLQEEIEIYEGGIPGDGRVELIENNVKFYADVLEGQKTGWFFDQRPHRAWIANVARDKTLIDVFCHTGGFGITAAANGAKHVTFVDTSAAAITLTKANAALNGLTDKCEFIEGKAFDVLEDMRGKQFDIVCVDPPAFVKTKKDMVTGLKGYEKLARLATPLVKEGGILFYASCSSHPTEQDILKAILDGVSKAGKKAYLVYQGTAGPDHPVHPLLPETRYLKAFAFKVI